MAGRLVHRDYDYTGAHGCGDGVVVVVVVGMPMPDYCQPSPPAAAAASSDCTPMPLSRRRQAQAIDKHGELLLNLYLATIHIPHQTASIRRNMSFTVDARRRRRSAFGVAIRYYHYDLRYTITSPLAGC